MIVDSERSFSRDSAVCRYWLSRSEGFSVCADRRVLGVVERVHCDVSLRSAERLVVRSGRRRRVLEAKEIVGVVPARELLLVEPGRSPPAIRRVAARGGMAAAHALVRGAWLIVTKLVWLGILARPHLERAAIVFGRRSAALLRLAARISISVGRELRRQLPPALAAGRRGVTEGGRRVAATFRADR